jgi:redox-sensitive bicupin YhaK (pirin superfamily)
MNMTSTINDARAIVFRTRGSTHGPVTRLMSPGDLGELLKPFVFLDLVDLKPSAHPPRFGMHPHSGIATLTFLLEGDVSYEDTSGKSGMLPAGGVEWMRAGNGVWHTGEMPTNVSVRGFQLWIALPPSEENAAPESMYLAPSDVPQAGPVRVMLGRYGAVQSSIPAPSDMTYLSVRLKAGERWRYTPPDSHDVAWLAVCDGRISAQETVEAGELVIFRQSQQAIDIVAQTDTSFVLGSAVKHPHPLFTGSYSVHTSRAALAQGEAEIERLGIALQRQGRLG